MSSYSLTAILLICTALVLMMVGVYRQQKKFIIRAGALAAVAILMTVLGLTVGG